MVFSAIFFDLAWHLAISFALTISVPLPMRFVGSGKETLALAIALGMILIWTVVDTIGMSQLAAVSH
jgi:hypothetical protein